MLLFHNVSENRDQNEKAEVEEQLALTTLKAERAKSFWGLFHWLELATSLRKVLICLQSMSVTQAPVVLGGGDIYTDE